MNSKSIVEGILKKKKLKEPEVDSLEDSVWPDDDDFLTEGDDDGMDDPKMKMKSMLSKIMGKLGK